MTDVERAILQRIYDQAKSVESTLFSLHAIRTTAADALEIPRQEVPVSDLVVGRYYIMQTPGAQGDPLEGFYQHRDSAVSFSATTRFFEIP